MSTRMHRRHFLQATSTFLAALHAPLLCAQPVAAVPAQPRLLQLKLHTHKLDELRTFYHRQWSLPLSAETKNGFTLKTGPSAIEFTGAPPGVQPFYHFAWNIPENQFALAKAWLSQRTPLLRDSSNGKDEVHFAAWNAHAVYFRDPAGNIGELIARHTLKNSATTPFTEQSLLCVSEIGMVTDESKAMSESLATRLSWQKTSGDLSFVGDDMGYLIVAPTGRRWLPDRIQKAAVAPVEVQVNQKLQAPWKWPKQSYAVTGS